MDSTLLIANAFAANIEDEKQRVRVEQALAMAQVLMNQGIAISEGSRVGNEKCHYLRRYRQDDSRNCCHCCSNNNCQKMQ